MKVEELLASGFTCIESFLLISCIDALTSQYKMKITDTFKCTFCNEKDETVEHLRWLPPVLHFPEPLNFTKGFLAHYDGLVPVLARWCYNSF